MSRTKRRPLPRAGRKENKKSRDVHGHPRKEACASDRTRARRLSAQKSPSERVEPGDELKIGAMKEIETMGGEEKKKRKENAPGRATRRTVQSLNKDLRRHSGRGPERSKGGGQRRARAAPKSKNKKQQRICEHKSCAQTLTTRTEQTQPE